MSEYVTFVFLFRASCHCTLENIICRFKPAYKLRVSHISCIYKLHNVSFFCYLYPVSLAYTFRYLNGQDFVLVWWHQVVLSHDTSFRAFFWCTLKSASCLELLVSTGASPPFRGVNIFLYSLAIACSRQWVLQRVTLSYEGNYWDTPAFEFCYYFTNVLKDVCLSGFLYRKSQLTFSVRFNASSLSRR